MKYLFLAILAFTLGCQRNASIGVPDLQGEMTVVKDCTGLYLRHNGLDYLVCNKKLLAGFENGTSVKASLEKLKQCNENQGPVCYMYHSNEGWVRILSIQ